MAGLAQKGGPFAQVSTASPPTGTAHRHSPQAQPTGIAPMRTHTFRQKYLSDFAKHFQTKIFN